MKVLDSTKMLAKKRLILPIIGIVSALSIGIVSTVAGFQDSGTVEIQSTAGTLNLSLSTSEQYYNYPALLNVTDMIPDREYSSNSTIRNTSNIPIEYTITAREPFIWPAQTPVQITDLAQLTIKIDDVQVYSGRYGALSLPAMTLNPNQSHIITTSVFLPNGPDIGSVNSSDNSLEFKISFRQI